ncbi:MULTISPECIES: type II secretion system protein N [unclassified Iodidimonas]|jgi:general secretion pathway protein C|uniref:type II secretion system protein N n=1 Tax=unclassified Iodidimonas TaxID=2626145 RepID=UPI002482CA8D|nr:MULTISPECIES: type II secretion system protein N [unclassified Iodidimonas]
MAAFAFMDKPGIRAEGAVRAAIMALQIASVIMLAWLFVRLFWAVVAPLSISPSAPVSALLPMRAPPPLARPLKLEILHSYDPFERRQSQLPQAESPADLPQTSLDLKLYGVRVALDPRDVEQRATAIIRTPDHRQQVYRQGDRLINGVHLDKILPDHVIIDRGGARESLYLTDRKRPAAEKFSAPDISDQPPKALDQTAEMLDLEGLLQSVQISPRIENGAITGLIVKERGTATILQSNGLISGDVLLFVDGVPMTSVANLQKLAQSTSGTQTVTLEIEREGERQTISMRSVSKPRE